MQKTLKQKSQKQEVHFITQAGVIGAMYAALTVLFAVFTPHLTFGEYQFRVSEALTILPMFFPAAIPGLFVGCIVGNLFGNMYAVNPAGWWDILFGSLASLIAAYVTWYFRDKCVIKFKNKIYNIPVIALLSPVIFNALIVGTELSIVSEIPWKWIVLYVGLGEAAVVCLLGIPLMIAIRKSKFFKYIG